MLYSAIMMNELLTTQQIAEYLKLKPVSVRRKAKRGEIPSIKVGSRIRFDKRQVDRWLSQQSSGQPMHILIVDDEPVIGQLFRDSLDDHIYRVTTTLSSLEALELIKNRHFALIFLDLLMPELDGAELFRQIRLVNSGVPVVIITGYPDSEIMNRAMEHGPITVLRKPFTGDDILSTVHSFT